MEALRRVVSGGHSGTAPTISSARRRPSSTKHEKLEENWESNDDPVQDGLAFFLKYLGNIIVDHPNGEGTTASAVKKIVSMSSKNKFNRKMTKMEVVVSPRGIKMTEVETNALFEEVSIYRVSFCTNDSTHNKIFAFIARNNDNETMECHAFLCPKKKVAQAITLSVSHSFNLAFETWEKDKAIKKIPVSQSANELSNVSSLSKSAAISYFPKICAPQTPSSLPTPNVPLQPATLLPSVTNLNIAINEDPSTHANTSLGLEGKPPASDVANRLITNCPSNNPFLQDFDDFDVDLEFESLASSRTAKK
jgi:hypothetical protein